MGAPDRLATSMPRVAAGQLLRVRGVVQGVGFRPMVWRVARDLHLTGTVRNDGHGVQIAVWGDAAALVMLPAELRAQCPPLARIDTIDVVPLAAGDAPADFTIATSRDGGANTEVTPDASTCPDCLDEVRDAGARRWHHAFANCTHCGPRFSIVRAVPYDRANTGMAAFPMCPRCAAEYANPADRRFHAQPIACPDCGPILWLERDGKRVAGDPIAQAASWLRQGSIVAIKGIGSFHLVADATNATTVAALRARKHRPHKPLALMMRDLDVVRRHCHVTADEAQALCGPAAPVVLLDAIVPATLPDAIAPDTRLLGVMLPMSPLHHLLLEGFDTPLVFTSGNASGEPPCIDNAEALERLAGIADAFLLHDRPILNRLDDSVLRRIGDGLQPLRRSRGYAPGALPLPDGFADAPVITAMGAELKNTACLLGDGRAVLSQHFGDLRSAGAAADAAIGLERLSRLFDHHPSTIAVDLHPGYRASRAGREIAVSKGLALAEIQHHHAHIAACMADHGHPLDGAPVLGLAFDGLGLGDDGELWGGELLLVDYASSSRLASLRPTALPGGDAASRQPWRSLATQLLALPDVEALLDRHAELPSIRHLRAKPLTTLARMVSTGIHAPKASSTGRLFDAVAAALGMHAEVQTFEGQAAIAIETLAAASPGTVAYPFALISAEGRLYVDPTPLWPDLLADLQRGIEPGAVARRFLNGLAAAWTQAVARALDVTPVAAIALSGGVFQNALFCQLLLAQLRPLGLPVWTHRRVPANDGGLALGQAVIAAARALQPHRSN